MSREISYLFDPNIGKYYYGKYFKINSQSQI